MINLFCNIKEHLEKIYSMIPDFDCKHCHKCCNNIIWFEPENIQIRDFMKHNCLNLTHLKNLEFYKKNKCPFLSNLGCIIYPVRPIVCRLQGNIKELQCDLNKNNKFINLKKFNKIRKDFIILLDKTNGLDHFYSSRNINMEYFYENDSGK